MVTAPSQAQAPRPAIEKPSALLESVRTAVAAYAAEPASVEARMELAAVRVRCAAAIANLEVSQDEGLVLRAADLGRQMIAGLESLKAAHPSVGDVRGVANYPALELTRDRPSRAPLAGYRNEHRDVATTIHARLLDLGLVVLARWDFLFVAPPLVATVQQVDEALEKLDEVLSFTDQMR